MKKTKLKRKTLLKKTSKTQTIKLRIQALLRAILLGNRIGIGCAFTPFQKESVRCNGVLQCDHKFPRQYNATFADFDNLHLICESHNRWKHYHGEEARGFMDKLYGAKKMAALQKKAHQSCPRSKKEWLEIEEALKKRQLL